MWEFVINLLEVAILFLLFNNKLEKKNYLILIHSKFFVYSHRQSCCLF